MLWQSSLVFQERISHTHVKSMPCFRHGSGCVSSLGLVMIRFERYLILQEKYHVLWLLFFFSSPYIASSDAAFVFYPHVVFL